jgi:GAF domain-containing protein
MISAPLPPNEAGRLQALRELVLLDTPPEARFDRLVALTAHEFEVPIALISLIDEKRQWFKARVGLDAQELPRPLAFCNHAILSPRALVVEDLANDVRFFDSPVVTQGPRVRFYAGAPLTLPDGHTVGTLCILDTHPRRLDATSIAVLNSLRDMVVQEMVKLPQPA